MIKFLRIKNLATIEDIEIEFNDGFSILTGETGTGKSIIIDGIRMVIGEKGTADMIRTGEKKTTAEAIFHINPGDDHEKNLQVENTNELFIQRTISENGVRKSYLNGVLTPVRKIKEFSQNLVDIYGQNDHVFLRQTEYHLDYLDYYANLFDKRTSLLQTARELRKLLKEKVELEEKEREREQRLDFLDFQIKEIEKAQLKPNEEEELMQERDILKNAEKIHILVEDALNISYNQEISLFSLLSKLQNKIDALKDFHKTFEEMSGATSQFSIAVKEFSDFLVQFEEKHLVSPERLEILEGRLSEIEHLKRKYGNSTSEILSYLDKAKDEHLTLSMSQEKLSELEQKIKQEFSKYIGKAEELSRLRKAAAQQLERLIEKEIYHLGMKKARFQIHIESSTLTLDTMDKIKDRGIDHVEFLISPNPGEEVKPLHKIASGGELSRIMLALKTIGKVTEKGNALIFDEIDSGIGGKTAESVARKLKELSDYHQVICITHLPQIASFSTHHYKIEKIVKKGRTFTVIKKLNFNERIHEIARLTAGSHITETSLKNAKEILLHNLGLTQQDQDSKKIEQ